jgi:glycosyltransferase involved in cell wall biosynthesis
MIVRDEAAVLERCLASVRELIASWVICDTGSVDGTPELIERVLAGVPGELHRCPWRDFGHNRSELMLLAQGRGDYLLLLDADMTVSFDQPSAGGLAADVYLLRHATVPEYWIPRLVRGDRRWRYAGRTHEHLVMADDDRIEQLEGLVIHHHSDGGTRAEKYQRDLKLLADDLRDDPNNARAVFYLAQTHRDLGEAEAAIEVYERRAAMGGWDEEVFYSRFQAALLRAEQNRWPEAMAGLIGAWESRPARLEPVYELASRLRVRGQYQSAYLFARHGLDRPPPPDLLFVWPWVYRWGLLFEYSVSAYWVGEVRAAAGACRRLLALPDLPETYRTQTVTNLGHCVRRTQMGGDRPAQASRSGRSAPGKRAGRSARRRR